MSFSVKSGESPFSDLGLANGSEKDSGTHVDLVERAHELGVRKADHSVGRCRYRNLLR